VIAVKGPSSSELSWRTLGVGAVLGVAFAGVGFYTGAKTAIVDGGNIPAALLAFAMLGGLARGRAHAHEGNIVQTISSSAAYMALTGGMIGPMAALAMSGETPSLAGMTAFGIALGVLGCLLAIPLRAAFIVRGALPFPTGAATAEVLRDVYAQEPATRADRRVRLLVIGAVIAAAIAIARSGLGWIPELTLLPVTIGAVPGAAIYLGISWSPLLGAVGYLSGPRIAIALVLGAAIAWLGLAPWLVASAHAQPDYASLLNFLLWPGTGLMLGGTVGGIASTWRGMRAGLREVRASRDADAFRTTRAHVVAMAVAALAVVALGTLVFGVHPLIGALGVALAGLLCAAAARAIGETDYTPAGPLGGFAQLLVGIVAPGGVAAPLTGGAVVSGTLMHSAALLQNWKTGALVGARPRPQLIAQLVGVVIGAVACAAAFELIRRAYGLGNETMPMPAAVSWKATADIVQHGLAALPAHAPLAAAIALVAGIVLGLAATTRRFAWAPSPVAIGMAFIVPPYLSLTLAVGGLAYVLLARWRPAWASGHGVALVSGMIGGEAIAGLVLAALIIAGVSVGGH